MLERYFIFLILIFMGFVLALLSLDDYMNSHSSCRAETSSTLPLDTAHIKRWVRPASESVSLFIPTFRADKLGRGIITLSSSLT